MIRDKKYLQHIREQPCIITGQKSQACHFRKGTNGGTGMKPDDQYVVPLSAEMHNLQHNCGEVTFWKMYIGKNVQFMLFCLRAGMEKMYKEWKEEQTVSEYDVKFINHFEEYEAPLEITFKATNQESTETLVSALAAFYSGDPCKCFINGEEVVLESDWGLLTGDNNV